MYAFGAVLSVALLLLLVPHSSSGAGSRERDRERDRDRDSLLIEGARGGTALPAALPAWALPAPSLCFGGDTHASTLVSQAGGKGKAIPVNGSKSQFFEENKAIAKFFRGVTHGTFLELGALDGLLYSNTMVLEHSMQWRGILIEGSPRNYAALKNNRPNQIAVNAAICGNYSQVRYLEGTRPCCRGVVEFMPPAKQKYLNTANVSARLLSVPCAPLSAILEALDVRHINLFFLDVEGAEMSVLSTIDFRKVTFDVLCVEGGKGREQAYNEILSPKGYQMVNDTVKKRKNTWFVRNNFIPSTQQKN
jgi:FkbM family methyltransferase